MCVLRRMEVLQECVSSSQLEMGICKRLLRANARWLLRWHAFAASCHVLERMSTQSIVSCCLSMPMRCCLLVMTTAICCIGELLLQIEHLLSARMRGGSCCSGLCGTLCHNLCTQSFHLAVQRSRFLLRSR